MELRGTQMRREASLAWTGTRCCVDSSEEIPATGQAIHISSSALSSKQPTAGAGAQKLYRGGAGLGEHSRVKV